MVCLWLFGTASTFTTPDYREASGETGRPESHYNRFMPKADEPWQKCEFCERDVPPELITLHHLTPKQKGGKAEDRAPVCKPCHKQIHATFGNTDLARVYASLQALRDAPQLQPFLRWIRKQKPARNFRTIMRSDHPNQRRRRNRNR